MLQRDRNSRYLDAAAVRKQPPRRFPPIHMHTITWLLFWLLPTGGAAAAAGHPPGCG